MSVVVCPALMDSAFCQWQMLPKLRRWLPVSVVSNLLGPYYMLDVLICHLALVIGIRCQDSLLISDCLTCEPKSVPGLVLFPF